jgi:hypothetical protein
MNRLKQTRRRGSAYVFVLGAATLIATAGVLATVLQRQRLMRQQDATDTLKVEQAHASAIEYGYSLFAADPSGNAWRPFRKLVINAPTLLGDNNATHTITLTDPVDDDLRTANLTDTVRMTVETVVGSARRKSQANFAFTVKPVDGLAHALIRDSINGGGTVTVTGTTGTSSLRPTRPATYNANAQIGVTPAAFREAVEAVNGAATMTVPEPAENLFTYYSSIGTLINVTGDTKYDGVLFSPTSNPAGTGVNAKGVYVINANGKKVDFEDTRVFGTLVIINAHAQSAIGSRVSMSPAASDMPTLLVDGSIDFGMEMNDLTESGAGRNLNPTGAPYLGATDSDTSDQYPSRIRGLVYVSGNAQISGSSVFEGVLWIRGKLTVNGNMTLTARWAPLTEPIAGFTQATGIYVAPESVARVAP